MTHPIMMVRQATVRREKEAVAGKFGTVPFMRLQQLLRQGFERAPAVLAHIDQKSAVAVLYRSQLVIGFLEQQQLVLMLADVHTRADHPQQRAGLVMEGRAPVQQRAHRRALEHKVAEVGFAVEIGPAVGVVQLQGLLRTQADAVGDAAAQSGRFGYGMEAEECTVTCQQPALGIAQADCQLQVIEFGMELFAQWLLGVAAQLRQNLRDLAEQVVAPRQFEQSASEPTLSFSSSRVL